MSDDDVSLRTLVIGADPLARGGLVAALGAHGALDILSQLHPLEARGPLLSSADALLWDLGPGEGAPATLPEGVLALASAPAQARRALAAGAHGVLPRAVDPERIALALRAIASGMRLVDAAFANALLPAPAPPRALPEPLTPREQEVLEALSRGLSNRGIARALGISEHTAKFHVNAILGKLDARTRTEAVVSGIRAGLLRI
ncbi:MAG: response regulator transcription factor [Alphaproteobacteria bacterium]|nr:response regulator transcription factor [Alphaproteobacteria bacterium]